ncbi:DNA mismatch repair protein Vsr [Candidatus Magnetobacterium bavaricum]|uniref:DNA mismatch repair protein Vsr n=1 Tax=Candidatus Magnetobacterium bavaricum TaxID=29290 RepID=A0A0F3GQL2_9BACT|nr:DNA mismatch repair protein Vsr [Candidatus Magnetobacterium bavaricum]
MPDVFSKAKRSEVMSSISSKGNRSTEWKLRARLISAGISGWKLHPANVFGKPDFVFHKERVAIFVDGCFWHGCKKCRTIPISNRQFWDKKLNGNKKRDKKVTHKLKQEGWNVLRLWEHQLRKDPARCIKAILLLTGKGKK